MRFLGGNWEVFKVGFNVAKPLFNLSTFLWAIGGQTQGILWAFLVISLGNYAVLRAISGQFLLVSGQFLPKKCLKLSTTTILIFSICFKIFDSGTDNFIVSFIVSFIMSFDTLPDLP